MGANPPLEPPTLTPNQCKDAFDVHVHPFVRGVVAEQPRRRGDAVPP
jgi:hypothetical protein